MKIYHEGLDVYDEQDDRKARTMFKAGWVEVEADGFPADGPEAAADPHVEHPDDPAVESITYSDAELKKRNKSTTKAGSK